MRKQYLFRPSPNGFHAWEVDRLVKLAAPLPVETIMPSQIAELGEPYWFTDGEPPTCRTIAEHFRLMRATDLQYPILLCTDGRLKDGIHRVTNGQRSIAAVRFPETPAPDFTDVQPGDLPY